MNHRTLETLRGIVSARLGFAGQGASIGANKTLIDSLLQNAQSQLYWMQNWKKLTQYDDLTLGLDQYQVDYPTAANPERILAMAVNIGSGSDQWRPLKEGITIEHYNTQSSNAYPQRYERFTQIELWPKCDTTRTLRVWYVQSLADFTADADTATVDDEMILLHATATAKAHYRHPDATIWSGQLDSLLTRIRGTAFGNRQFHAAGKGDWEPMPRPQVV